MRNREKLQYVAGFHTVSGNTKKLVTYIDPAVSNCIKSYTKKGVTCIKINPNNLLHPNRKIDAFSIFEKALETILIGSGIEIEDFTITRADLAFDMYDVNDYELYQKLNILLISCIAYTYNIDNTYESYELWTHDSLNLTAKSQTLEIENYNKHKESNGTDLAKNRLEVRSKRLCLTKNLPHAFTNQWFTRWDESVLNYELVLQQHNMYLEKLYKEDLLRPKKQRKYYNLTAFLMQYSNFIFSRKQMINLLSCFSEVSNPQERAKSFKKKHNIEYFTMNDLKYVVTKLKEATIKYFID